MMVLFSDLDDCHQIQFWLPNWMKSEARKRKCTNFALQLRHVDRPTGVLCAGGERNPCVMQS